MKILFLSSAMAAIALPATTNAFGVSARTRAYTLPSTPTPMPTFALAASALVEDETTEIANPRLSGLAFALDDGTRKSHSMAENTAFVQGFFKGISSADSYKNLLTSLYHVYYAMEVEVMDGVAASASSTDSADADDATTIRNIDQHGEWIQALDSVPLRRLAGLEQDMEYFYGSNWKAEIAQPTKGTQLYVDRIRELAASTDETYLFVAHQYTRYLGDLFGGQMMGSMASRSMDLPTDGSGVRFYEFQNVPSTKDFITEWYTTLNALGVTPKQQQAIVDEANLVFQLNIGILEELEGSPWAAVWTMAVKSASQFTDWKNIKESKNSKN